MPALDFYRPIPLLLAAGVIFHRLHQRKRIKTDMVIWFTLLFIFYFIINIGINGGGINLPHAFREILRRYVVPLSVYFTLINLAHEIKRRTLVHVLLWSGIYIAGVGIAEFAVGRNLIGPIGFVGTEKLYRTNGPFWDGIGYAGVVLMFLPLSYYCLKEKLIGVPFYAFCVVIFSAGCLVNYSRAIWLTFILIAILLLLGKDIKTVILSFYMIAFLAIVLYFLILGLQGTELFESRLANSRNIIQRYEQYRDSISLVLKHPFFGNGFWAYMKTHHIQLHNSYLLILVEFGLVGAFFFTLHLIALLFIKLRQSIATQGIHAAKLRLSIIFLAVIVPNTIDFLGNAYFILMMFVITAVVQLGLFPHDPPNKHRI